MKKLFLLILVVSQFTNAADLATELLKASDQGRGGFSEGIQWEARIDTFENDEQSIREFSVRAKQNDAYVEATAPAKNKNKSRHRSR